MGLVLAVLAVCGMTAFAVVQVEADGRSDDGLKKATHDWATPPPSAPYTPVITSVYATGTNGANIAFDLTSIPSGTDHFSVRTRESRMSESGGLS